MVKEEWNEYHQEMQRVAINKQIEKAREEDEVVPELIKLLGEKGKNGCVTYAEKYEKVNPFIPNGRKRPNP